MSAFTLQSVHKFFISHSGVRIAALSDITLEFEKGKITCVLGPTGSGKSTLLRLLAGLEEPDSGQALVDGKPPSEQTGRLGYLTQNHTLLPWLKVRDNIALPLRLIGISRREREERAEETAAALGLRGTGDLYPYELSGGMQRRAALGRLLVQGAPFWLLDEPFTNLDERTQNGLHEILASLVQKHGLSVAFVTHSVDEAVWLGDRIAVLTAGPGKVAESFDLSMERPRDRLSQEYGQAMERIRKSLASILSS